MDEDIEVAAYRELKEETGFVGFGLEQFRTYGAVDRDPRGRTVSIVYTGTMMSDELPVVKEKMMPNKQNGKLLKNCRLCFRSHDLIIVRSAETTTNLN